MENYKEKLRIQNITFTVIAVILALFAVCAILAEAGILPFFSPTAGDSHWQSKWRGFVCGAACGILGLMLFCLYRNTKALKNEKELKKLYIKCHDERTIQIWTAARAAAFQTFLLLGLAAIVITGYFSITVSITILSCVLVASLIGMGFKVYYDKKF